MTCRFLKTSLVVVAAVLSPLTLLTTLIALNTINPMAVVFLTEFTVVNEGANEIWVTPIGAIGQDGGRKPLPYSRFRDFYLLSEKDRDFYIPPQSSRTFVYDWDDIQFSEILIRTDRKAYRVLSTGLHPTKGQYRRPKQNHFVVGDFESLNVAEVIHLKALESSGGQRSRILHSLAFAGLLPPVLLLLAFTRRSDNRERNFP